MNRLIAVAIIIVAIVTFQEWHRQMTAERNAELEATLTERDRAIRFLVGEGGIAEVVTQRLKAEGGIVIGTPQPVKQEQAPEKPKEQPKSPPKAPKLNGQADTEVYSGGHMPAADWR